MHLQFSNHEATLSGGIDSLGGFGLGGNRLLPIVLLFFVGVSVFAGCTYKHTVVPVGLPLAPNATKIFKGASPLQIINTQNDHQEVNIHPGNFEYYGVMHDWTQAAVDLLQNELSKIDVAVVSHAPKKLMMRVLKVELFLGGGIGIGPIYFRLFLEVQGSNVPPKIFEGAHASSSLDTAAGGAVTNAVAALLRDPTFIDFIKQ